jgi:hypothetical protein
VVVTPNEVTLYEVLDIESPLSKISNFPVPEDTDPSVVMDAVICKGILGVFSKV